MSDPLRFNVFSHEASHFRQLLRKRWAEGVRFEERRSWLVWIVFTVSGPAEALAAVQRDYDKWRTDLAVENAW